MAWSMIRAIWARLFPKAPLTSRKCLWIQLSAALRERGAGVRESGAFLLGPITPSGRRIEDYVLYDDLDPNCLQGMILFDGAALDKLWEICASRGLQVVADVHTHPLGYGQSQIDRDNPMIAERGHIAFILPHFAAKLFGPGEIGIYELVGRGCWVNHSAAGRRYFKLTGAA